jgi:hypothetical protein
LDHILIGYCAVRGANFKLDTEKRFYVRYFASAFFIAQRDMILYAGHEKRQDSKPPARHYLHRSCDGISACKVLANRQAAKPKINRELRGGQHAMHDTRRGV